MRRGSPIAVLQPTLDRALTSGLGFVWCKDCRHKVEADPAAMAVRYGAEMTVPDWRERLVCSQCGGRNVDMVVTGTARW